MSTDQGKQGAVELGKDDLAQVSGGFPPAQGDEAIVVLEPRMASEDATLTEIDGTSFVAKTCK